MSRIDSKKDNKKNVVTIYGMFVVRKNPRHQYLEPWLREHTLAQHMALSLDGLPLGASPLPGTAEVVIALDYPASVLEGGRSRKLPTPGFRVILIREY